MWTLNWILSIYIYLEAMSLSFSRQYKRTFSFIISLVLWLNSGYEENLHFFTEGGVWVLELVLRAASQRGAGREEVDTQVREVPLHRLTDILQKKLN